MSENSVQLKFEYLLSHTFPGFFLAVTVFMLVDVLSPIDLTTWALKDIKSIVSFTGFVVLFGTIFGIIADGIQHSLIHNIFDNFKGMKEILDSLNEFFDELTELKKSKIDFNRFYLLKPIGKDIKEFLLIDEYLLMNYYYYSEFYANTFILLIPFSIILPFYLINVLEISCIISLYFGLITLILACVCLNSSYTCYKEYYLARYSIIRGFMNNVTKNDNSNEQMDNDNVGSDNTDNVSPDKKVCIAIGILVFLLDLVALIILDIIARDFFIILIVGVIISIILYNAILVYLVTNDKQENNEHKPLSKIVEFLKKNTFPFTLTILSMLVILWVTTCFFYSPTKIILEPKNFEESIYLGNNSIKVISIKNLGDELTNITFNTKGISWLSINPDSFQSLKSNELEFFSVNVSVPQNETTGEYRGAIIIKAKANERDITEIIPVVLHIYKI